VSTFDAVIPAKAGIHVLSSQLRMEQKLKGKMDSRLTSFAVEKRFAGMTA
jgi:hypothetical protein